MGCCSSPALSVSQPKAGTSQWAAPSPALSGPQPKAGASQWAAFLLFHRLLIRLKFSPALWACQPRIGILRESQDLSCSDF